MHSGAPRIPARLKHVPALPLVDLGFFRVLAWRGPWSNARSQMAMASHVQMSTSRESHTPPDPTPGQPNPCHDRASVESIKSKGEGFGLRAKGLLSWVLSFRAQGSRLALFETEGGAGTKANE